MHPILNIAINAARRAGDIIVRALDRPDKIKIFEKGQNNYVTNVDRAAEADIIESIQRFHPDHSILAEEQSLIQGSNPQYRWIIDPLDGTTNFIHGYPHFCVSIAVASKDQVEHGVIYDPIRQELFSATRGGGAQVNGRRMRVSPQLKLDKALLNTGFPYRNSTKRLEYYLKTFNTLYSQCAGVRRAGAAALDLAYVAAGRVEGYWELGISEWDMAAGSLIVKEAGGIVSDLQGSETYLTSGNILAATPKIHQTLVEIFKEIPEKSAQT